MSILNVIILLQKLLYQSITNSIYKSNDKLRNYSARLLLKYRYYSKEFALFKINFEYC